MTEPIYASEPEQRLDTLLSTASRGDVSEADIKSAVRNLVESLVNPDEVRQEVSVLGGSIDILVRNTIIEVKRSAAHLGVAPEYVHDDQRRNYAATQLQDYVNARYSNVVQSESTFYGFTTNGSIWNQWFVQIGGDMPKLDKTFDLSPAQMSPESTELIGTSPTERKRTLLENLNLTITGRASPPNDLAQLLSSFPEEAAELAREKLNDPEFETKRSLWEDLMRGAFIVKSDDEDLNLKLFAQHSVLVEIARRVIKNLSTQHPSMGSDVEGGFSSWLYSQDDPKTDDGKSDLLWRLHRETDRYNWRLSHIDVLKDVYHAFIPSEIRHDFGQYFTPDWLTEGYVRR